MRLEEQPRLVNGAGFFASTLDWARRVTLAFNPVHDAVYGPAFDAYRNGMVAFASGNFAEVLLNVETEDTNSCFNPANGRFTPSIAGLYFIAGQITLAANAGQTLNNYQAFIFKNGATVRRGDVHLYSAGVVSLHVSGLVRLNGTTDYVTLGCYGSVTAGTVEIRGGSALETTMSGFLARRA